jgi:hypothetical protein
MNVPLRLVSSEESDGVDGVNREATQDRNGIGPRRYLNATRVPNRAANVRGVVTTVTVGRRPGQLAMRSARAGPG